MCVHLYTIKNLLIFNKFVVYFNDFDELNVYDDGDTEQLTTFQPKSYKVGDNIAAYVTDQGQFYVYWNGEMEEWRMLEPSC